MSNSLAVLSHQHCTGPPFGIQTTAMRAAANHTIQSVGAEITKRSNGESGTFSQSASTTGLSVHSRSMTRLPS